MPFDTSLLCSFLIVIQEKPIIGTLEIYMFAINEIATISLHKLSKDILVFTLEYALEILFLPNGLVRHNRIKEIKLLHYKIMF
jgi:hypothetical protein